uniref:Uncharacterized protein n=1 Tax=Psilocybe cubensis TaxID=181762 RepID=A0A8H7XS09_PSICU
MDGQVNWKWDANTQGWVAETPPEHPLESVAEEVIAGYIFDVISSMKAVEEVIWKPERKDSEQTHKLVMDALKTLPNLRHIDVSVTWLRTPLDLDSVTSLQEIIMHEISETLQVDMFEGLAKAVAQNPQLHLIDIRNAGFYRRNIDEFQCLHQVFKYYPREAPPLRLRDLRMFECRFRLDDITIPHLQHLTSLQLLCVEEHCTLPSQPASQSGANLDRDLVLQGKDSFCSNLEDVWTAFRSIGVQLENISIDMVPSSFLDYLASYSGLKKLNIDLHKLRNSELSDSMAAKFYDKSIIGHTNTLEELILSTSYEGLWCIGPHNFKTLAQCKNMERLCIGVNLSQLPLPSDRNGDYKTAARSDIEHNLITTLLNTAVTHMPKIQFIRILEASVMDCCSARPCEVHSVQGPPSSRVASATILTDFIAPASCKRLPFLAINSLIGRRFGFVGCVVEDGELKGSLRYVLSNN